MLFCAEALRDLYNLIPEQERGGDTKLDTRGSQFARDRWRENSDITDPQAGDRERSEHIQYYTSHQQQLLLR